VPAPSNAQPQDDRPPDALLERTDLQAIVDAQVRRDGAALLERLDASDPAVRARAAFALASVQDTAAVPALLRLLRDSVPEVRADAAFALGQMPSGVPAEPLLRLLGRERDAVVQRRLIEALGKTGDPASLRSLVRFGLPDARDPDLALAMARYGMRDAIDEADPPGDAAHELMLDWLVEHLTADRGDTRRTAAYVFTRLAPVVWEARTDTLRAVLDSYDRSDPAARHLIRALGALDDRAGGSDAPRLQRWLREAPDWRTRVNAARALSSVPNALRTRQALQGALDDSVGHVAIAAAQSLTGADWSPADVDGMAAWIEAHPDRWRVIAPLLRGLARNASASGAEIRVLAQVDRWEAAGRPVPYAAMLSALAPLDTSAARHRLVDAAGASDPRVAASALSALAERWKRERPTSADAYFSLFAAGVSRGDIATINAAAPALTDSLFRSRGAADTLAVTFDRLTSPDDLEGMTAVLRALGQTSGSAASATLRGALGHPHPAIRTAAAEGLTALADTSVSAPPTPAPEAPPIDWDMLSALGPAPQFELQTEKGAIIVELDATQAPQTVETICGFANDGRYDGVPFHRVVANFVIQGGDFARQDGWGGPGFFIRSEFTRIPYTRGVLGMASAGKDTEGSQFFLTHSPQPHLDGRYTAVGRVTRGLEVMDRILANDVVSAASCRSSR